MTPKLRMTYPTAMVLQALAAGHCYGFEIADVSGLRPGSVYQILRRLEDGGLAEGDWEDAATAHEQGRPPRRYYRLTGAADDEVARARERFPGLEHVPGSVAGERAG